MGVWYSWSILCVIRYVHFYTLPASRVAGRCPPPFRPSGGAEAEASPG
jgi:hypothetical protein